jgi:predicted DNA-binding transcriptional regulator YafY
MSSIKDQHMRYIIIDNCLKGSYEFWSPKELLKVLAEKGIHISERTLDYDIKAMRKNKKLNYEAPIAYSRKHNGYYYTDPYFTIQKVSVSEEDLRSLNIATRMLEQHKGLPVFEDIEGVVEKLVTVVNQLNKPRQKKTIDFEKAPYYKGKEFIEELLDMIDAEQPLEITYQKFDGARSVYLIHPYLLKEYKKRWYLVGYYESRKIIASFGLDRMERIKKANVKFVPNSSFNSDDFFKSTLGITTSTETPERIILSFDPKTAPYIKTQHLHESQTTLKDENGEFIIELTLIVNYELTSLLLGYGPSVKVLAPERLRDEIKKAAQEMAKQYEE